MELMRLNQHEENDKKKKGNALKASSSTQEGSDKEDSIEIDEDDCHTLISSGNHLFVGMRPSLDHFEVLDTHC